MLVLLLFVNFAISWFNAWACGKSWPESKHEGGIAHFMNWMGAIMSASGFTWCYVVIAALIGSNWDVVDENTGLHHPFLNPETAALVFKLGYMVVILPILGSGLALTVQSWAYFWRRRTLANGVTAGWNTFAQISNTVDAMRLMPEVFGDLMKAFGGGSDSKDSKSLAVVIFLVVVAVFGGILTTYAILRSSMQEHLFGLRLRAEGARLAAEARSGR